MGGAQEWGGAVARLPVGVLRVRQDADSTILDVNPAFLEMFGYTRTELREELKDRYSALIHPADLPGLRAALEGAEGDAVELEYRAYRRDGSVIRVLEEIQPLDGPDGPCFLSVLIDITRRRESQEALRLSAERMQVIMDQTNDIIFEWDLLGDVIQFSSNWKQRFGYSPISGEASARLTATLNIHPDDRDAYLGLVASVRRGTPYTEVEYRILCLNGQYLWHRARATVQYDDGGKPIRAVGVLVNVDAEKRRELALVEQTRKDGLTKLYNKTTARTQSELLMEQWEEGTLQALMIIDLDNFKRINDRYGHLCGDAVLTELGASLKRLFRTSDNLGRIGGDEFLAYLPGLPSREVAIAKAEAVLAAMKQMTLGKGGKQSVSCSIGISFYPDDGADYARLYHSADLALYQAKGRGKSGWAVYDPLMCQNLEVPELCCAADETLSLETDAPAGTTVRSLSETAFQLLCGAVSVPAAMGQIMELIGRTYDVSRVYVYTLGPDGVHCSNTFEWCAEGVSPYIAQRQNRSLLHGATSHLGCFDENGVFYCRDVQKLEPPYRDFFLNQGASSVLQCIIRDEDDILGFVGVNLRDENRYWTREEIQALTMVAQVLSVFLGKLRLKERLAEAKG